VRVIKMDDELKKMVNIRENIKGKMKILVDKVYENIDKIYSD